jgi:Flp pilus assembly protein TadG
MSGRQVLRAVKSKSGTAAVEFALLLPALAMLTVGTLSGGLVMYSVSGLHNAVEAGARCYSVDSIACSSASAAQTYAQSRYYGVSTPTFTASTPSCGHQVSGTLSVVFSAVVANWTIPLSAVACYP